MVAHLIEQCFVAPGCLGHQMVQKTDASAGRSQDPGGPPLAQCSCAHPATAIPCSSSSKVRAGLRASRRFATPSIYPAKRFSCGPGAERRDPTKQFYLGDAIHAMTPTLGRGANIAMRDSALLERHLGDVVRGRQKLAQALSEYETEVTTYGFDVVKKAAAMGERLVRQNPLPSGS
jgi:hypothetical protein